MDLQSLSPWVRHHFLTIGNLSTLIIADIDLESYTHYFFLEFFFTTVLQVVFWISNKDCILNKIQFLLVEAGLIMTEPYHIKYYEYQNGFEFMIV